MFDVWSKNNEGEKPQEQGNSTADAFLAQLEFAIGGENSAFLRSESALGAVRGMDRNDSIASMIAARNNPAANDVLPTISIVDPSSQQMAA